ncbi:hypothetical protein [uncultured Chryseobacterium sp.]|uniref:hypothetical protein n=1 Tax=uncultured Chryseobacterium sp. TaxID=259322 RepID=UPI00261F374B|nr:hypothetical protein [uncultured Chryseobacterium sp.]
MRRHLFESRIKIFLVIATFVMTILRFLLNEKGRATPDSIRFMRTANVFPEIDNTTTPLGYPLSLKLFTFLGLDEFWSSKVVGILAYLFIVFFARAKKFYFKETVLICGLFSFVSIFSYTVSEALILPFVFLFLYISRQIIIDSWPFWKSVLLLSLSLISLYSIRYSALFFVGAVFLFGLIQFRKKYGKIFLISAGIGILYIVLYKFLFIDRFNSNYINEFLEIGVKPTSQMITEFFAGITTTFNPFIHISNPNGGMMNIGIFGIGALNIVLMAYIFIKNKLSENEKFIVFTGVAGIICSFFIQYFYSMDALDYRLLAPFSFPVWLVYFKKIYQILGKYTYGITVLSLITGLIFTALSSGNYLENRKEISRFLEQENLKKAPLKFYIQNPENLDNVQITELISTVNPNIKLTFKPNDTLQKTTLTTHKVLKKVKIDTNKFQ